jgi:hypothetical protein
MDGLNRDATVVGGYFSSGAFARFLLQNIFGSHFRESEENARIADNGFRPQSVGGLLKVCEVLRTHFHVDLDSTLPGSFHLLYRYVSTL